MKEPLARFFGLAEKKGQEVVRRIPVDSVLPNPYQPRTVFDDERIEELCHTIRTHGIIQPIVVRKREGGYELIAGERRLRAAKKLGMERIPAVVREMSDTEAASAALIENLQREGLTAIEEAAAYQKLIKLHGLTQESLAQRLGKASRPSPTNCVCSPCPKKSSGRCWSGRSRNGTPGPFSPWKTPRIRFGCWEKSWKRD